MSYFNPHEATLAILNTQGILKEYECLTVGETSIEFQGSLPQIKLLAIFDPNQLLSVRLYIHGEYSGDLDISNFQYITN